MRPAATPCPGQAAPKSEPANATGSREPAKPIRSAVPDGAGPGPAPRPDAGPQTRVSLPCWPTRAFAGKTLPRTVFWPGSPWNRISRGLSRARAGIAAAPAARKFS